MQLSAHEAINRLLEGGGPSPVINPSLQALTAANFHDVVNESHLSAISDVDDEVGVLRNLTSRQQGAVLKQKIARFHDRLFYPKTAVEDRIVDTDEDPPAGPIQDAFRVQHQQWEDVIWTILANGPSELDPGHEPLVLQGVVVASQRFRHVHGILCGTALEEARADVHRQHRAPAGRDRDVFSSEHRSLSGAVADLLPIVEA